jgi:predicted methyltransferase
VPAGGLLTDKSYREVYRILAPGGHYLFNIWDSHGHNFLAKLELNKNRAQERERIGAMPPGS